MVAHFLANKSGSKKPTKLTQREFEAKYADGYDKLVALLQSYVSQGQQDLKNREHSQRLQIENLIAKRKQLKKLQTDLQEMKAIDREALERAARQKADQSDVGTSQQDSQDTEQPEESDLPDSLGGQPGDRGAFEGMKNLIAGHAHIEEKTVSLLRRGQKIVVGSADAVSRLQKQHRGRGVFGVQGFRELLDVAQECEQLVTANQSRVTLGDFLLHDPKTLYQQFGKDSIIVLASHSERVRALGRRQAAPGSHARERPSHEPLSLAGRVPLQSRHLQTQRHRSRRLPLLHEGPRAQEPPRAVRSSPSQGCTTTGPHAAKPRDWGFRSRPAIARATAVRRQRGEVPRA